MGRAVGRYILLFTLVLSSIFGSDINLIEPTDAIRLIGSKSVVFVSGESNDSFQKFHIVGSIDMPAQELHHSDIMGNMKCAPLYSCPKESEEYMQSKGIKNEQLIIVYDNFLGSSASGVYNFLESIGHEDIKLLNGGLDSIISLDPNQQVYDMLDEERGALIKEAAEAKKSGDIEKAEKLEAHAENIKAKMDILEPQLLIQEGEEEKQKPSNYTIDPKSINREYLADKVEVKRAMDDILKNGEKSMYAIIDTRSMQEIIGKKKPAEVVRGGHIPGAKFISWKNITDFEKKKNFQPLDTLQKVFDKAGITKEQKVYVYSHFGAGRASHVAFALRLLGYKSVKVFTGSWDTWGNDLNLPVRR